MADLDYTDLIPQDTTPETIEQELYDALAEQFPGWEPTEPDLLVWLAKWQSQNDSQLFEVMSLIGREIFAYFGRTLMNIPMVEAIPATVESDWTLIDTLGHTIPDGTLLTIPNGGEGEPFLTAGEVTVNPGSDTATVTLIAQNAGTAANNLAADPTVISSLAFVDSIELDGTTGGGVNAETIDEYLPRLRELLQLMSPRPILERHFEVLARQELGVFRAVAIEGLDPVANTTDNPLHMTIAVMDANGDALDEGDDETPGTREYVKARIEAQLMADSVIFVIDADYTTIDVTASIVSLPGFNHADVCAAVETALENYLTPINWGRREGFGQIPTTWVNSSTVYYLELTTLVNNVPGVDRINTLTFKKTGGSHNTTNVSLTGDVPLTQPGAIAIT